MNLPQFAGDPAFRGVQRRGGLESLTAMVNSSHIAFRSDGK